MKLNNFLLYIVYPILLFFIFSLFLSFKKIYIAICLTIIFLFINKKIKYIFLANVLILTFILKFVFIFIDKENIFSEIIYEKNYLYGVRNLNKTITSEGGDLQPFISEIKENKENKEIKIITDNLGFRNKSGFKNQKYVLVGDSFIHNVRISDEYLINNQLNKINSNKFYNASLTTHDISNYLELIKFFKKQNNDTQFIMFIFAGNDFLNYKKVKDNYGSRLDNKLLNHYFELKKFFNFHNKIGYLINLFKNKKSSQKITKSFISNTNFYFYNDYFISKDLNLSFSDDFKVYKNSIPDYIIVIPTKAQIYCNKIEKYNCEFIDYGKIINNNFLFKDVPVYDSTYYLKKFSEKNIDKGLFIFDKDDTHLNEIGIKQLSKFLNNILTNG